MCSYPSPPLPSPSPSSPFDCIKNVHNRLSSVADPTFFLALTRFLSFLHPSLQNFLSTLSFFPFSTSVLRLFQLLYCRRPLQIITLSIRFSPPLFSPCYSFFFLIHRLLNGRFPLYLFFFFLTTPLSPPSK